MAVIDECKIVVRVFEWLSKKTRQIFFAVGGMVKEMTGMDVFCTILLRSPVTMGGLLVVWVGLLAGAPGGRGNAIK